MYPVTRDRSPSSDTTCQCGCPWTIEVNSFLAEMKNVQVTTTDAIHSIDTMNPIHVFKDVFIFSILTSGTIALINPFAH
jgi:hypothetical protein